MAGVITRFTCVVERDSSGVITPGIELNYGVIAGIYIHRRDSRAVVVKA